MTTPSTSTDNTAGLELVTPPNPEIIALSTGSTVHLKPLVMRQIKPFTAAVTPLAHLVGGIMENAERMDPVEMLGLVEHEEQLRKCVAVATGVDFDELGDLELDEFARLVVGVIRVNLDFFGRRLLPMVAEGMQQARAAEKQMKAAAAKGGPAQSKP